MKVCFICKQVLPESSFTRNKNMTGGLDCSCKGCRKQRRSTPEKLDQAKNTHSIWLKKDPRRQLLYSAREHAKELGVPCTITVENIELTEFCPISGVKLRYGGGKRSPNSASIDRIVPDLGYIPGNVAVISDRFNRIKSDATLDQILAIIAYMEFHEEHSSETSTGQQS